MHGRGEISLLPLPGYDGLTYVAGGLRCQFLCNFYKRLASGSLFNLFSDCLLCPLMRPSCRFCFKLFVYSLLGGKNCWTKALSKGALNHEWIKAKIMFKEKTIETVNWSFCSACRTVRTASPVLRSPKEEKKEKEAFSRYKKPRIVDKSETQCAVVLVKRQKR
jgi:hypothetical protein